MSEQPEALLSAEARKRLAMRRFVVPTETMVRSAYECDEIDSFELEWLMEAAVFRRGVELPERMASLRLAQYRPGPPHLRAADAVLREVYGLYQKTP